MLEQINLEKEFVRRLFNYMDTLNREVYSAYSKKEVGEKPSSIEKGSRASLKIKRRLHIPYLMMGFIPSDLIYKTKINKQIFPSYRNNISKVGKRLENKTVVDVIRIKFGNKKFTLYSLPKTQTQITKLILLCIKHNIMDELNESDFYKNNSEMIDYVIFNFFLAVTGNDKIHYGGVKTWKNFFIQYSDSLKHLFQEYVNNGSKLMKSMKVLREQQFKLPPHEFKVAWLYRFVQNKIMEKIMTTSTEEERIHNQNRWETLDVLCYCQQNLFSKIKGMQV